MGNRLLQLSLLLFFSIGYQYFLSAQCKAPELGILQGIAAASPDEKENKILSAGFDLRQATTLRNVTTKIYTKCWMTSANRKDYFEHKLLWNLSDQSVKLAMLSEEQFQELRRALDEKHPAGIGSSVVAGKMFTYYLGQEDIDGISYYTVTVVKR